MKTINKILSFIFSFTIFIIAVCLLFLQLDLECLFSLYLLGAICLIFLLYVNKENKL